MKLRESFSLGRPTTANEKIARRKLSLLQLAQDLANVSRACTLMGYSRQQFEAIEHRTARVKRPQSNGIVERLHRTLPDEHFRVEGRRTWFETIEEMQAVVDSYLKGYNHRRPHEGRA